MDRETVGYGTMQLTGPNVWGPPPDWSNAIRLLRSAYDQGVRLFDTAWYYGPSITHQLLAEALYPYPDDLVLLTKAGNSRNEKRGWKPALTPQDLRAACDADLSLLRIASIPLLLLRWQPHPGDSEHFLAAMSVLTQLRSEGKIRQIGLSNVEVRHIEMGRMMSTIAAVSNSFSVLNRRDLLTVEHCEAVGIMYLPYYPLLGGNVLQRGTVESVARALGVTPAQVAIAWLRQQSDAILPIPGTSNERHLKQNIEAWKIQLPRQSLDILDRARLLSG